jgi:hypothetical protein
MSNMKRKQVNAILSDYDGTLCPTTSVSEDGSDSVGMIPNKLKQALGSYIQTHTCMHNI